MISEEENGQASAALKGVKITGLPGVDFVNRVMDENEALKAEVVRLRAEIDRLIGDKPT